MSLLERRYGDRLEKDGHEFIAFAKEGAGESGEELMRR
jgi:hypothetical protein